MPPGLKQKVGPLPLYGWLAIVGAVVGVLVYRMRQQNAATETATDQGAVGYDTAGVWGPTDPNTGIPFAFESATGAAQGTGSALDAINQVTELVGALEPLLFNQPSPGEQLGELTGWIQDLKDSGLLPGGGGGTAGMTPEEKKAQREKLKQLRKQRRELRKKLREERRKHRGRGGHQHPGHGGGKPPGGPGPLKRRVPERGKVRPATSTGAAGNASRGHRASPHPAGRALPQGLAPPGRSTRAHVAGGYHHPPPRRGRR